MRVSRAWCPRKKTKKLPHPQHRHRTLSLPLWNGPLLRLRPATCKRSISQTRNSHRPQRPQPQLRQKLQQAISADRAAGIPTGIPKLLSTFNDLLENSESLIQAIQNKDAAGVKKYSDLVQTGLKTFQSLSDAIPTDYETKTYGPMQKAYDAAIKALKS